MPTRHDPTLRAGPGSIPVHLRGVTEPSRFGGRIIHLAHRFDCEDAPGMTTHKDVVVALLGASAGLAGLVLVFLGLVSTNAGSFPPGTKPAIVERARRPALAVLVSFGFGLVCTATATLWLLRQYDHQGLYVVTVALFAAQLVSLSGATVWAVWRTLWG
jgi:hypothetical protein